MTAIEVLRRNLDSRGVEYVLDEDYGEKYPPEQSVTWSCDIAGEDMTVTARDYCIGKTDDGEWDYCLDLEFHEVFTPEQAIAATLGAAVTGEISDGFHTMSELYHHRAVLFSVIVRDHRELAWKSRAHHDGSMYDGMFIVGIETPQGQATYHYYIDPYWDMFDCEELERAPEWDGHSPDDAIARVATLGLEASEAATLGDIDATDMRHGVAARKSDKGDEMGYENEIARLQSENDNLRKLVRGLQVCADKDADARTDCPLYDEMAELRCLKEQMLEDLGLGDTAS